MVASEIIINTTPPYLSVAAVKNNDNNNIINIIMDILPSMYACKLIIGGNAYYIVNKDLEGCSIIPEVVQGIAEGVVWVWLVNTAEVFWGRFPFPHQRKNLHRSKA